VNSSFTNIIALLKTMLPAIEPLGEAGINQLFVGLTAWANTLPSPDEKRFLLAVLPGIQQFAIGELQQLKG
jgi:hypothetical protein